MSLVEARELQDSEISLLEAVYGEASDGGGLGIDHEEKDATGSERGDLRLKRGPDGRVHLVECVIMRECPTAIVFTPFERKKAAADSNTLNELLTRGQGAKPSDVVWATPGKRESGDLRKEGEGATKTFETADVTFQHQPNASSSPHQALSYKSSSSSAVVSAVPVGFIYSRPMAVWIVVSVPPLYPFAKLRNWRIDSNRLSKDEQQQISAAVGDLVRELTGETPVHVGTSSSGPVDEVCDGDGQPLLQIIIETARDCLTSIKTKEAHELIEKEKEKIERDRPQARKADRKSHAAGGDDGDEDDEDDGGDFDEEEEILMFKHKAIDTRVLGRRCVYFHHILSKYKRCVIMNMARRLELRGFCKVGYPGILIVEGSEEACEFYVQVLQRLRWKLMVVRGEERIEALDGYHRLRAITSTNLRAVFGGTLVVVHEEMRAETAKRSSKTSGSSKKSGASDSRSGGNKQNGGKTSVTNNSGSHNIDAEEGTDDPVACQNALATRRAEEHLASRPILETGSADEIAGWCNMCGLTSLFRTVMKIYN